ncbi:8342_t:CDS:2, partial [Funneliformis geosporum]
EYLEAVDCTRWNLLGALRYVSSKTEFTSKSRAEDDNLLKPAQNKARQLSQELDISEPAIKEFLDSQDLKLTNDNVEHGHNIFKERRNNKLLIQFHERMQQDYATLYEQSRFCDVTVKISDQTFMAHYLILYTRSSFFRNALSKSVGQCEIMIPNITPKAFEGLLKYIYCGTIVSLADSEVFDFLYAAIKLELDEI